MEFVQGTEQKVQGDAVGPRLTAERAFEEGAVTATLREHKASGSVTGKHAIRDVVLVAYGIIKG